MEGRFTYLPFTHVAGPNPFLSSPLRTVDAMSCTTIPDPLRDLLATVAAHPGTPVDRLDQEQYAVAVAAQRDLDLPDAVFNYVGSATGYDAARIEVLLAVMSLNGLDRIPTKHAARRLGLSHTRVSQLVRRLWRLRDAATPPTGIWMPQIEAAERDGWPDGYMKAGIKATKVFFGGEQRGTA